MNELQEEAQKYAKSVHKNHVLKTFREYSKKDFIAGATSNYVEKQKLKFAIEQLNILLDNELICKTSFDDIFFLKKELEQKLKEYE